MTEFVGLRATIYSYLKDTNDEDKNAKCTKTCVIKKPLKFEAQIKIKINHFEKNEIEVDKKEFIKNNKVIIN